MVPIGTQIETNFADFFSEPVALPSPAVHPGPDLAVTSAASRSVDRFWRAVPAAMCTFAWVAAACALVLSRLWIPAVATGEAAEVPGEALTAATWADAHVVTVVMTMALALLSFVTAWRSVLARRRRIGARALVLTVVAGLGMLLVRPLVLWEELGLRRLTIDTHWRGMWPVAFSDQVTAVVIDHEEIQQGAYRLAMITHSFVLTTVLVLAASIAAWNLSRAA